EVERPGQRRSTRGRHGAPGFLLHCGSPQVAGRNGSARHDPVWPSGADSRRGLCSTYTAGEFSPRTAAPRTCIDATPSLRHISNARAAASVNPGGSMTKLVMTLLARDNADIVAANLDFHLAMGVDHVVVTDNRSEDETRNIVLRYVRRGVATLIDEPADDYDQSAWATR